MKRSEMLEKIHEKLLDQPMTDDWPNQILSALESLGMEPPRVVTLDLGDCQRFDNKWEIDE